MHLTSKQKEVLEHENRQDIFEFLKGCDEPASLGEIAEGADIGDLAVTFFHLNRLIKVKLVEQVFGMYRVVEP